MPADPHGQRGRAELLAIIADQENELAVLRHVAVVADSLDTSIPEFHDDLTACPEYFQALNDAVCAPDAERYIRAERERRFASVHGEAKTPHAHTWQSVPDDDIPEATIWMCGCGEYSESVTCDGCGNLAALDACASDSEGDGWYCHECCEASREPPTDPTHDERLKHAKGSR